MPVVSVVVHPNGLHPVMQVKARHLVREEGMSYDDACDEVHNMQGKPPSKKSLWSNVQRIDEVLEKPGEKVLPQTKYGNCGRHKTLTDQEKIAILEFVQKWPASASAPASTSRLSSSLAHRARRS